MIDYAGVCPKCGGWSDHLSERTGFCSKCTGSGGNVFTPDTLFGTRVNELKTQGLKAKDALKQAREELAPHCLICGDRIHGRRTATFCSKKPLCRKAASRRHYLTFEKKLSFEQASQQVIREFGVNTNNVTR